MQEVADQSVTPTTIAADLCAIFVSLEPGADRPGLPCHRCRQAAGRRCPSTACLPGISLRCWALRFSEPAGVKVCARTGKSFPIVVIQEAGLDGFWIHRVLLSEGIETPCVSR